MKFKDIDKCLGQSVHNKSICEAKYLDDLNSEGMLYLEFVRSSIPHGYIKNIILPKKLEEGYFIFSYKDIPGENYVFDLDETWPILVKKEVKYIGDEILMVVGRNKRKIKEIISEIKIEYEELEGFFDIEEKKHFELVTKAGNQEIFNDEKLYKISRCFETNYQEQLYLETQSLLANYDGKKMVLYASTQCPFYIKTAASIATGLKENEIEAYQTTTGGGFGGKEDYPDKLAAAAAAATYLTHKPIKLVYNRKEDLLATAKRHPSKTYLTMYIDKDTFKIKGIKTRIYLNSGAYTTITSYVLFRSITSVGLYNVEAYDTKGYAAYTNTCPSGAFRGFGSP